MATPTDSIPGRWQLSSLAETVASVGVSAACYRFPENIGVVTVVVPELKFRDVQRQVFLADLVIAANDPALEDAPKTLNRGSKQKTCRGRSKSPFKSTRIMNGAIQVEKHLQVSKHLQVARHCRIYPLRGSEDRLATMMY